MNIDENVRKILIALLRKWKLIVIFAIIGGLLGFAYTANFTKLTYTSTVEFLAYATDTNSELQDSNSTNSSQDARISNTSKMNYAMKMLDTYIEIMNTNEFNAKVADSLNQRIGSQYNAWTIRNALSITAIENTAMFKITVTTDNADLSYEIAHQLESTVPSVISKANSGLVNASVEDKPIKASSAGSLGYPKKCAMGAIAGMILAAAYVVLRNFLDIRVHTGDELIERYDIPVLGSVPNFEGKGSMQSSSNSRAKKSIDDLDISNNAKEKGDER